MTGQVAVPYVLKLLRRRFSRFSVFDAEAFQPVFGFDGSRVSGIEVWSWAFQL